MKPAEPQGMKDGAPKAEDVRGRISFTIPAHYAIPFNGEDVKIQTVADYSNQLRMTTLPAGMTTAAPKRMALLESEYNSMLTQIEDLKDENRELKSLILTLKDKVTRVRSLLPGRFTVGTDEIEAALDVEPGAL